MFPVQLLAYQVLMVSVANRRFPRSGHMVQNKLCWDSYKAVRDFQNKEKSGRAGKSSFVLKVPLGYLGPSVIYFIPCDRIMQMAY